MPKEVLTDRRVKSLKPAAKGRRQDYMDAVVPGLGVRVTDNGRKTFVLVTRFPGSQNPTRRALGGYGALTLEDARRRAREWHALIARGIDPRDQENEERAKQQIRRDRTFGAIVEDYVRLAAVGPDEANPLQRKGPIVARELRDEFVNDKTVNGLQRVGLGKRPIEGVTRQDIVRVIDDAVARGARYQAHNLLGHVRTLFNWAIGRGVYGLETSPCDRMKPRQVIGQKALRTRILGDAELRAFWRAAHRLRYPYGPLFKMLALTGQRKSEVAEAAWSEFDLETGVWIIPAERMKADAPHVVPLPKETVAIIRDLPRFTGKGAGPYLFSTTRGIKPVNGFSKSKVRLDLQMVLTLRALARAAGEDASRVAVRHFVVHDVRRTVRTKLSGLPVSTEVAELVIAHARPGLRRVYDQFSYLEEKRRALELWAGQLAGIVRPAAPTSNVVPLRSPAA